jgi:hypothetical protein
MRVERLTEDDWEVLKTIRLQSLQEGPPRLAAALEREWGFKEDHWRMRLRGAPWFVAFAGRRVVGLISVISEPGAPSEERHLMACWVASERAEAGTDEALVAAAEDLAQSEGAALMTVWIADGDDDERELYQRTGYAPSGVRMPMPRDRLRREERWTKRLQGSDEGAATPADPQAN